MPLRLGDLTEGSLLNLARVLPLRKVAGFKAKFVPCWQNGFCLAMSSCCDEKKGNPPIV